MTTTTKIGGFTKEQLINTEIKNGLQLIKESELGFEIVDRRDLRDRIYNTIKGRGVKRTFGATHFVVTEKYYNQLISA